MALCRCSACLKKGQVALQEVVEVLAGVVDLLGIEGGVFQQGDGVRMLQDTGHTKSSLRSAIG